MKVTRFAVSPLTEKTDAQRSLVRPAPEAYHLTWQRQVRPRLPGLRLELSWPSCRGPATSRIFSPGPGQPVQRGPGRAGRGAGDAASPGGDRTSTIRHRGPEDTLTQLNAGNDQPTVHDEGRGACFQFGLCGEAFRPWIPPAMLRAVAMKCRGRSWRAIGVSPANRGIFPG
jgi:hypothetical protein